VYLQVTDPSVHFREEAAPIMSPYRKQRPRSLYDPLTATMAGLHVSGRYPLAVSRHIEHQTGWTIRKFGKTARRYRTVQIQAGQHTITAADPLPDDFHQALEAINHTSRPVH
jgi:hypothetical protein